MPGRVRKVELDHPNRTHKSDAVVFKQGRPNLLFSFGVSRLYDTVPRYVQYSERCIILPAIRSYGRAYAGVETLLLTSWSFDPRSITKLEIISVESCLLFVFRSSRSCKSVSCFSLSNRRHVRFSRILFRFCHTVFASSISSFVSCLAIFWSKFVACVSFGRIQTTIRTKRNELKILSF